MTHNCLRMCNCKPVWMWTKPFLGSWQQLVVCRDGADFQLPFHCRLTLSLASAQPLVSCRTTTAFDDVSDESPHECSQPFFLQKKFRHECRSCRMRLENWPGVNLGVKAEASANADGVGSMSFDVELEEVEGDDWVPNGKQRRRFVGRWLRDSQSKERFKVAQAITTNRRY